MSEPKRLEFKVGKNTYVIETGEIAKQANGSVMISVGECMLIVTATASKEARNNIDFFPLVVDYEEKMYSIGKIPGNYGRREAKPAESSTLTSRLIDRPIRPMFPEGYFNEVQIIATLLSGDQTTLTDIIAINGASAALAISDIPFLEPIGAVRVGRINNKWVLDPTYEQLQETDLDLVIVGTDDKILMIEAGVNMLNEEMLLSAISFGHKEIKNIVKNISDFVKEVGKPKQTDYKVFIPSKKFESFVSKTCKKKYTTAMNIQDRPERRLVISKIKEEIKDKIVKIEDDSKDLIIKQEYTENPVYLAIVLDNLEKDALRKKIINDKIRIDGRACDEVRPISSKVGFIPRTHGSALFTRGETQVMSIATLGTAGDMQNLDEVSPETQKRYIHHYNFTPFSVGEVKPLRGPGRRELGHGALARRALLPVLPTEEEFPYTIRVVSEVMGSNGSTSMASTCGSTLTLLDAGVPLKKIVGGVAMGLIKEGDKYVVLTDILSEEDHCGDMDFKVTGSSTGVTALQMDIKIDGISLEIMKEALEQARKGRLHIISKMMETIDKPKEQLSKYAPKIISFPIPQDKIGELIGPGGKTIKKIVEETGVKIDIDDSGIVFISSSDQKAVDAAKQIVDRITKVVQVGEIFEGTVVKTMGFAAIVELYSGQDGFLHVSQISEKRIKNVEDEIKVGQKLKVKVMDVEMNGRVALTIKGVV